MTRPKLQFAIMNEDGSVKHDREALVTELLFMMYEHPCCSDPDVYRDLYSEAKVTGWELPDGK